MSGSETVPLVFIDTNVLKFSATRLRRIAPRLKQEKAQWGDIEIATYLRDIVEKNLNEREENPILRSEAEILPLLADLGKKGHLDFCIQLEAEIEEMNLPKMDSQSGKFFGASIRRLEAPIKYDRILAGWNLGDPIKLQFEFLSEIGDKRFLKLQKITGAYQGENGLCRRQLLDAFHLWCAEFNGCQYFLTLDFKLHRMTQGKNILSKVVTPSELLQLLQQ